MASKVPVLRKGLTVSDLKSGCWVNEAGRFSSEHELPFTDEIVDLVLQRFIDHANSGERVHRKTVSNTCCMIADMLKALKDTISDRMGKGDLTPTLLDQIADA